MPKSKLQKEQDLKELIDKLKKAKGVVLTDYRGTSVKNIDKFRKTLRKENVFSKVYKITLLKKAVEAAGIEGTVSDYKTPIILSVSEEDETISARSIKALSKEVKSLRMLEGIIDGKIVNKTTVMALADLPSKDELRAQVIRTINGPVSGFVNVLSGNLRGLINVFNAMVQKV